jgi:hypothetical protein
VRATFRYVLLTAIRDRFPIAILVALVAITAICVLIAASTISEGRQTGLAYAGELFRTSLVIGLVTFVCFHVRDLHQSREIEAILSRPISRGAFVVAYFCAFAVLAMFLTLVTAPLMMVTLGVHGVGLAEWEASMILECWIVVAMSLFAAMSLASATAAMMVTIGFYALGRTADFFLAIGRAGSGAGDSYGVNEITHWIIVIVTAIMPRLDLFGQSRWLVYGPGGEWGIGELLLQAAIYVPLLLLATTRDLRVRTF